MWILIEDFVGTWHNIYVDPWFNNNNSNSYIYSAIPHKYLQAYGAVHYQQQKSTWQSQKHKYYKCVEKIPSIKVHRVTDPLFKKYKFWSWKDELVNSSLVLYLSAVVGCSSLLSRVKPLAKGWFQLAPVSWPSCRQQASLFMHGHGTAAFPFLLQILLLFQILGYRCRIFQGLKDPPF